MLVLFRSGYANTSLSLTNSVFFFLTTPPPPRSTLFPYTTLFRSKTWTAPAALAPPAAEGAPMTTRGPASATEAPRSEEHTSELQSRLHLVCRLLLEKKKKNSIANTVSARG